MKLIIEGLWALGKTSACEYLEKEYGFVFLREPDHKKQNLETETKNMDIWYYDEHARQLNRILETKATNVVAERSLASTLAFIKSRDNDEDRIKKWLETFGQLGYASIDTCIIFHADPKNYLAHVTTLRNNDLKSFMLSNWEWLKNYSDNLNHYCKALFGNKKLRTINTFEAGRLINKDKIFNLVKENVIHGKV